MSDVFLSVMLRVMSETLLKIKDFGVRFSADEELPLTVRDVGFEVRRGKTLAIVGESGSGKSLTALAIMRLLPGVARVQPQTSVQFQGVEITNKSEEYMRGLRGQDIGMIFQEPLTALNPLHNVEKQIAEPLIVHKNMTLNTARPRVLELLDLVGLSTLKDRLNAYPHELSGGQRQRVMIAMALANEPKLLIADEPTTALDVTVQAQILDLLQDLKKRLNMGLIIITHDLGVVRKMADDVCVMEKGAIVEQGKACDILSQPNHQYTQRLLNAQPSGNSVVPDGDSEMLLHAENLKVHFSNKKNFFGKSTSWVKAVNDVSVSLKVGHTLGIVGESGSGKSTLAMAMLSLVPYEGRVVFAGRQLNALSKKELKEQRSDIQAVFQDPFGSLSPRMSVGDIIAEGLLVHQPQLTSDQRDLRVVQALSSVYMPPESRFRYPHEFSGGQRQRISIARALILKPKVIILDEPTSALDVSVQAEIVDLLRALQQEYGLSYVFISHDLRVVQALSHDVVVMKDGEIVEFGVAKDIFSNPQHSYTQKLLSAVL